MQGEAVLRAGEGDLSSSPTPVIAAGGGASAGEDRRGGGSGGDTSHRASAAAVGEDFKVTTPTTWVEEAGAPTATSRAKGAMEAEGTGGIDTSITIIEMEGEARAAGAEVGITAETWQASGEVGKMSGKKKTLYRWRWTRD